MSDLYDDATAQGWLTHAVDVLTKDVLWTRQLNVEHMTPAEMGQAAEFGETLRDAWLLLTKDQPLDQIERYVQQHVDRAAYFAAQHQLEEMAISPSDLSKRVHTAVITLKQLHQVEADSLERKIGTLRAEVWTPGDLTPQSVCALLLLTAASAYAVGLPWVAAGLWAWFLNSECPNIVLGL